MSGPRFVVYSIQVSESTVRHMIVIRSPRMASRMLRVRLPLGPDKQEHGLED